MHALLTALVRRNVGKFLFSLHHPRIPLAGPTSLTAISKTRQVRGHATARQVCAAAQKSSTLPHASTDIDTTSNASLHDSLPTSAYIHLPFCRRRCHYCDFTIVPVGERISSPFVTSRMEDYVRLLCQEIGTAGRRSLEQPLRGAGAGVGEARNINGGRLRTIFFGGGTPSLLPPNLLRQIIEALDVAFGIDPNAEISMEMDPGTFDNDKLHLFLESGVNRVSLGVQSFSEDLLKACGRAHGLADVYHAISAIQSSAVSNWSLDLISSLPSQSLSTWHRSLSEAVKANPAHISIYDLQIERGTAFGRKYTPGEAPLPNDHVAAQMYTEASRVLREEGYDHYEISNYSRKGRQCEHNLVYWRNEAYYGFGLGAASYVGRQRVVRPKQMKEYGEWVRGYVGNKGRIDWPCDGVEDRLLDTLMLGLRLADGLNVNELELEFGQELANATCHALLKYEDSGHVVRISSNAHLEHGSAKDNTLCLRLSDPEGFLMSNDIISSLFNDVSAETSNESV